MSGLSASDGVRVLIVEDEPLMAEAIRDGLRPEADIVVSDQPP